MAEDLRARAEKRLQEEVDHWESNATSTSDNEDGERWQRYAEEFGYALSLFNREAEHLADMTHCQERVVNLLEAAKLGAAMLTLEARLHRGALKPNSARPLQNAADKINDTIAREEKEGSE